MLEISDQEFHFIRKLVYEKSRINLGDEKKQLVCARLSRRLHTLGLHSFSKYLQRLTSSVAEEEITELIDAISTNYTQFFREWIISNFSKTRQFPNSSKKIALTPAPSNLECGLFFWRGALLARHLAK